MDSTQPFNVNGIDFQSRNLDMLQQNVSRMQCITNASQQVDMHGISAVPAFVCMDAVLLHGARVYHHGLWLPGFEINRRGVCCFDFDDVFL
jgi:hypothetical protein